MMSVYPDIIRVSVGTKVAGLFVLIVLAVAFFAFPLASFAASGNGNASVSLVGVVQAGQVFDSRTGGTSGSLSSLLSAPVDTGEKASQLKGGSFFLFKTDKGSLGMAIAIGPGKGVIAGTTSVVSVK